MLQFFKAQKNLLTIIAVIWLVFAQTIFFLVQRDQGEGLKLSIRGQLRKEAQLSDFSLVSRNLADLEASKTIRCVRLELVGKERTPIFDTFYKGNCDTLDGSTVAETLKSVNGDTFYLQFKTVNHLVFYAALWMLRVFSLVATVGLFYYLFLKRKNQVEMLTLKIRHANEIYEVAKQISHDIRSPLSALSMVVASLKDIPEEKRLIIRNATQRINDIANQLLGKNKTLSSQKPEEEAVSSVAEPVLLVGLLDSIVSEKRVQFRERMEIDIQGDLNDGYGLFVTINPTEFSRSISNLVNNSVEAFHGPGRVTISIRRYNELVQVFVADNGKGIPEHVLARLGERGVTFGKDGSQSSGSGLGVYHARQTAEAAGGSFAIQSQLGFGTTITLSLPRAETPKWFVDKIHLPIETTVVSADDDQTIHQIWSGRLSSFGSEVSGIKHLAFSSCEQFENWVSANQDQTAAFFVDYEFLGQTRNGLDVIERTGIGAKAILVTSRYEEPHLRLRASSLGVRILPKSLAPFVPIEIEKKSVKYHAVLIDDDELVRMTWRMAANEQGKDLVCFSDPSEFFAVAAKINPSTPIYVDVSLGNGVRGEDVAQRASELGFTEIRLATGYEASALQVPPCVQSVISKDPVFL